MLLVAIAALLFSGNDDGGGDPSGNGEIPRKTRASALVTRVVDGDTAEMEIEGFAGEEDVRFIGVDTPESVTPDQPVECYGPEASDFTRNLIEGRRVRLEFGAEQRDRFGRLLAYVYIGGKFLNEELVSQGYARTLEIAPNTDFAGLFARIEQDAANAGRGLWGRC
jgi:micrococcal nuclease